jgi:hypothetical protein
LEDATVASIDLEEGAGLGSMSWADKNASSYCEMAASLVKDLKTDESLLDEQIATALLTGIVAATDRFSNAKTSSRVMTTAADLMAAGANQQLIAVQLKSADAISDDKDDQAASEQGNTTEPSQPETGANGELAISHEFKGDVDEVANQVEEVNQEQATKAAEDELAQQLGVTQSALPPLQEEQGGYEETPLRGAVGTDQWKTEPAEPLLGGTLNATTEEAAEVNRLEEADAQNHTILSHDSGGYITGEPAYQAPMSAAVGGSTEEPQVNDIFAENPTAHVDTVDQSMEPSVSTLPPTAQPEPVVAPVDTSLSTLPPAAQPLGGPTLADIDAANRSTMPPTVPDGQLPPVNPVGISVPGLPPLPPMPDFSTLPPLPTSQSTLPPNSLGTDVGMIPPAPLGSTLPPAPQPEPGKTDPSQFKIPGQ